VYCAGCSDSNISTHFYLAPGEEKAFAASNPTRHILFRPASLCSSSSNVFCAETSGCNVNGSAAPGTVVVRNFGFEYIAYIDGQQVTKQQIGKDLSVACK
jgi:hypothetical protein